MAYIWELLMDMNESTFGKLVKVQRSRSWLITILFSLGFTMNYSMYVYNMYNYIYICKLG